MLMPRKTKYRKTQKGRVRGFDWRGSKLSFGEFGLKALEAERISARQIEASRRAMTRYIKRGGKIWIRVFPDKPITQKGAGMKMGKGKGAVDHYAAVVKPGRVLFEMAGVSIDIAKEALKRAADKLSIKTRFIAKDIR